MKEQTLLYTPNPQVAKYLEAIRPLDRHSKYKPKRHPQIPKTATPALLYNKHIKTGSVTVEKNVLLETANAIPQFSEQRTIDDARLKKVYSYLKCDTYCSLSARTIIVAQYPDGSREIVDGNTRRELWHNERVKANETGIPSKIDIPKDVNLIIYHVKDHDEAVLLYFTFDNKNAHETVPDKIGGAMESLGIEFENPLLTLRKWKRMVQEIVRWIPESIDVGASEERAYIEFFEPELKQIDAAIEFNQALGNEVVGIMTGMLYVSRNNKARCRRILQFFNHVGCKTGDYAANGKKNAVTFMISEYDKANIGRRYHFKSTHRNQMFGLWTYYFNDWEKEVLRSQKCPLNDKSLAAIIKTYFK